MRTLLATVGVIMIVLALGAGIGEPAEPAAPTVWVRTVDGWERDAVLRAQPRTLPVLHPLVVAGTQLLASLGILVAASDD